MFYKVLVGDRVVSSKCFVFETFFSKFRGLMFRGLGDGESVILSTGKDGTYNSAIHMFFVFYPIDVAWVNSDMEVVDLKRVYPFTPYASSRKPAKYVLEMKKSNLKIGDEISLVPFS